jgi:hypothetical protein
LAKADRVIHWARASWWVDRPRRKEILRETWADLVAYEAEAEAATPEPSTGRLGRNETSSAGEGEKLREALSRRSYAMSGPHLSGYHLVLGFNTREEVDAAHKALPRLASPAQPAIVPGGEGER